MRVAITHYCELCNTGYGTSEAALTCEAKGPGVEYPIGMMWRVQLADHVRKIPIEYCEKSTYAIAVERETSTGHARNYGQWKVGPDFAHRAHEDTLPGGPAHCFNKPFEPTRAQPPDPSLPSFRRMVDALLAAGVTPTMWDGGKAVPLPTETQMPPETP